MRTGTPKTRFVVRLKDTDALRDAMDFNRLNVRELSEACGNMRYRSTIGHLHSGARMTCSVHLAGRIESVLRLPPRSLFKGAVTTDNVAPAITKTTGKRRAA